MGVDFLKINFWTHESTVKTNKTGVVRVCVTLIRLQTIRAFAMARGYAKNPHVSLVLLVELTMA